MRGGNTSLGERLRKARLASRFTLEALWKRTGITISSLSRFENGRSRPSFEDVCAIAEAVGWPLLYFGAGRERSGNDPRDLLAHLAFWGLSDQASSQLPLIGESRPFEDAIVSALGASTTARLIEAIPALLLKNEYSAELAITAAERARVLHRLGWLAEIAEWISSLVDVRHIAPGSAANLRRIRNHAWHKRGENWDNFDRVDADEKAFESRRARLPPISVKWRVLFETPQERFLERARAILEIGSDDR